MSSNATVAAGMQALSDVSNLAWVLGSVAAILAAGSLVRWWLLRGSEPAEVRRQLGSLAVWWVILVALAAVGFLGPGGVIVLVTAVSGWALWEYFSLVADDTSDRQIHGLALAALPVQALWIYLDWYGVYVVFLPLGMLLLIPAWLVIRGRTESFRHEVSLVYWGLMMAGYCLSHAACLSVLPEAWNPRAGGVGWFVYLVLLTQANDIAQALWGRRFGNRPLARRVSPRKTWEGLLAGVATTLVLSVVLGAWLTPLTSTDPSPWNPASGAATDRLPWLAWLPSRLVAWWPALVAGLLIPLAGLLGDLTISGLKRDLGVKDSGRILPGQGGILDRIDSMIFAAPVLFYYVRWLHA